MSESGVYLVCKVKQRPKARKDKQTLNDSQLNKATPKIKTKTKTMTKQQTKKAIIAKIDQLNKKIDLKLIVGESYKKEMAQHTKLYTALKQMEQGK